MSGRRSCDRRAACGLAALALVVLVLPRAQAAEMYDGRIQAHGFYEMQVRGISKSFSEELNLTQWYNVLNLELEFDVAPDGVGPFDLISAYVRLEGRYDCVYSHGCGVVPNAEVFGNDSSRLPPRLSDAQDRDFAGVIDLNDVEPLLDPGRAPNTVEDLFEDTRPSGRTTGLLAAKGADRLPAHVFADPTDPNDPEIFASINPPDDDPGRYTLNSVLDFAFAAKFQKGNGAAGAALMAPWLPRNFLTESALLIDRANPYRGKIAPVIKDRTGRTRFWVGDPALFKNGGTEVPLPDPNDPTMDLLDPAPNFESVYTPQYCASTAGCIVDGVPFARGDQLFNTLAIPDSLLEQNQTALFTQFVDGVVPADSNQAFLPVSVHDDTNTFTQIAHGLVTGQPIRALMGTLDNQGVQNPGAGVLPTGLTDDTAYYAIVIDADTFALSTSAGGAAVDLGDMGSGTNTFELPPISDTTTRKAQTQGSFDAQEVFIIVTRVRVGTRNVTRSFYLQEKDPAFPVSVGDTFAINGGTVSGIQPIVPVFKGLEQEGFGGDLSNIVPNFPPKGAPTVNVTSPDASYCKAGTDRIKDPGRCPNGADESGRSVAAQEFTDGSRVASLAGNGGAYPFTNRQIAGGSGELPLRPAPDLSVLDTEVNAALLSAQGVYYPSQGYIQALQTVDFNDPGFNINETDRAFNRGQSQQDNKELKEAYLDIEMLESRLYMRLGLQNIVCGKTELFRTTDQFNPTDLGLSSLPSLEEARIGLWAAKFIYSFWDVGPLQDVRVEIAANIDDYQPADLGACGEPYVFDVICGLTLGIAAHGFIGLGVAGFDRPPDPWEDISALEVGGRVEWRWDRFSFALIDFYGYDDIPSPDPIMYFERNVDLATGRPLVTRFAGGDAGLQHTWTGVAGSGCATPGTDPTTGLSTSPVMVVDGSFVELDFSNSKNPLSSSPRGIGIDGPCLKAGGAADYQATNDFGGAQNALEFHPANQQFHAFACSATLGVVGLDPTVCALAIFGSTNVVAGGVAPFPASEFFSIVFTGEPASNAFIISLTGQARGLDPDAHGVAAPLVTMNRDRGPICDPSMGTDPEKAACVASLQAGGWDGIITARNTAINLPNPDNPTSVMFVNPGGDGLIETVNCADFRANGNTQAANSGPCRELSFHYDAGSDWLTLDSTLTNEQKALLGCGPFLGTRCDSADAVPIYRERDPGDGVLEGVLEEEDTPLIPRGGGIDLLNADASFLFQSWVGIEGTGPDNWTPRLVAAFEASEAERVDPDGGMIDRCQRTSPVPPQYCRVGANDSLTKGGGFFPLIDITPDDPTDNPVPLRFTNPVFPTWLTTAQSLLQPHTFRLGEYDDSALAAQLGFEPSIQPVGAHSDTAQPCTVFNEGTGELVVLPGCRGIESISEEADGSSPTGKRYVVTFQDEYLPSVDGCVFGDSNGDGELDIGGIPVRAVGFDGTPANGGFGSGTLSEQLESCAAKGGTLAEGSNSRGQDPDGIPFRQGIPLLGAQTLFHPMAGCRPDEDAASLDPSRNNCDWFNRDLSAELMGANPENVFMFQTEGAALSYNVQMFFVASSCAGDSQQERMADNECFDPNDSFSPQRCSFAAPQFCSNVKGFMGLSGPRRNVVQAGGTNGRGRRVFLWNSGGEIVLQYDQRNVLGFSTDFAEDVTKTNWNMEFTWVGGETVFDANSFNGVNETDTLNLTVSVDRPTFINFLNPNRTFFFNSQWFFQYFTDYEGGFGGNGPWNILFTFAILAGYFQDRLLPQFVTVYDFQSQSGGVLPQMQYRFTENFSATIGANLFFGQTELKNMPIRGVAPNGNRADPNAYKNGEDNLLSLFRGRDELFLRLRWTF